MMSNSLEQTLYRDTGTELNQYAQSFPAFHIYKTIAPTAALLPPFRPLPCYYEKFSSIEISTIQEADQCFQNLGNILKQIPRLVILNLEINKEKRKFKLHCVFQNQEIICKVSFFQQQQDHLFIMEWRRYEGDSVHFTHLFQAFKQSQQRSNSLSNILSRPHDAPLYLFLLDEKTITDFNNLKPNQLGSILLQQMETINSNIHVIEPSVIDTNVHLFKLILNNCFMFQQTKTLNMYDIVYVEFVKQKIVWFLEQHTHAQLQQKINIIP
jgi:hypothetical protein